MEKDKFNPDHHNTKEKGDLLGKLADNPEEVDSKVNLDFNNKPDGKSLTNDEDADTDPNKVANKPKFKGNH
ncbi:hypothetical protein J2X31_001411 [Flavobacterium arsenatis]|uniref:Uncharacterized protein n=1 Tax=Flavobacterium arsenatis TaxID=1484332 RepID=A0ABU1TN84_9FLAO|nr:hypothetical protein [Flavobacterium arsenatis]MDR6967400.1 hypothetical protein [Flavobacterium arsenatis]